jgi:hypothetical protein
MAAAVCVQSWRKWLADTAADRQKKTSENPIFFSLQMQIKLF